MVVYQYIKPGRQLHGVTVNSYHPCPSYGVVLPADCICHMIVKPAMVAPVAPDQIPNPET
jgi:hypothetical protein